MILTNQKPLTNGQTQKRKTLIVEVWDTSCTAPKKGLKIYKRASFVAVLDN